MNSVLLNPPGCFVSYVRFLTHGPFCAIATGSCRKSAYHGVPEYTDEAGSPDKYENIDIQLPNL